MLLKLGIKSEKMFFMFARKNNSHIDKLQIVTIGYVQTTRYNSFHIFLKSLLIQHRHIMYDLCLHGLTISCCIFIYLWCVYIAYHQPYFSGPAFKKLIQSKSFLK